MTVAVNVYLPLHLPNISMKISIGFLLTALSILGAGTSTLIAQHKQPDFLRHMHSPWVDSVMATLSPDERIAQLIVVAAWSNRDEDHKKEMLDMIARHKIGGLIFFQGGPGRQAALTNAYQAASKVPLLIAMDAEWGLGMRLDSTISYPYQMALGAVQDETLIYRLGARIAQQMQRLGVHVNFAPVVDVNNNPNNPVINYRSFGEDKFNVARKGVAYMRGLQDHHVMATAKHFTGHGDTDTDSHHALPRIDHSRERIDSLELYPFRQLIQEGVGGIMVAHLNVPALDDSGLPSTLSRRIVYDLLREELGYQGIIVTDAMNMKGVTGSNPPGVVDKDAILAGNDVLEFTEDVPRAIAEIRAAIRRGLITQTEIDARCRRMLALKQWVGLDRFEPIETSGIVEAVNTPQDRLIRRKLIEHSLTVLYNKGDIIPIRDLDTLKVASVAFAANGVTSFQKTLDLYTEVTHFTVGVDPDALLIDSLRTRLKDFDLVIASVHDNSIRPLNRWNLAAPAESLLQEICESESSVVVLFKNPYVMSRLPALANAPGLVVAYQDDPETESVAAQLVFGGIGASGRLPVSVEGLFPAGSGLDTEGGIRFS